MKEIFNYLSFDGKKKEEKEENELQKLKSHPIYVLLNIKN